MSTEMSKRNPRRQSDSSRTHSPLPNQIIRHPTLNSGSTEEEHEIFVRILCRFVDSQARSPRPRRPAYRNT